MFGRMNDRIRYRYRKPTASFLPFGLASKEDRVSPCERSERRPTANIPALMPPDHRNPLHPVARRNDDGDHVSTQPTIAVSFECPFLNGISDLQDVVRAFRKFFLRAFKVRFVHSSSFPIRRIAIRAIWLRDHESRSLREVGSACAISKAGSLFRRVAIAARFAARTEESSEWGRSQRHSSSLARRSISNSRRRLIHAVD